MEIFMNLKILLFENKARITRITVSLSLLHEPCQLFVIISSISLSPAILMIQNGLYTLPADYYSPSRPLAAKENNSLRGGYGLYD